MAEPGLVMFWFGADLFFANAACFAEQARKLVHDSPSPVRWLVIDTTAITGLDFSADRASAELQQDLAKAGVVLALVVLPVKHRADLERMGLMDLIGANRIFDSRHACLAAYNSIVARSITFWPILRAGTRSLRIRYEVRGGGSSRVSIHAGIHCLVSGTGLVGAFRLNGPIVAPCGFLWVYDSHHGLGRTATRVVEHSASRRLDSCADSHRQARRLH